MIALTSISPSHYHKDIQEQCISSWQMHGIRPVSFNNPEEAEKLSKLYPYVKFIPTHRTMQHKWGKPYVQINAMLDWAKDQPEDDIMLINSDILLKDADKAIEEGAIYAKDGIAYAHRIDIESLNDNAGSTYTWGLDVFFLNKKHLPLIPQSLYCMGQTFWDFWLPYTCKMAGLRVHEITIPFAFHLKHEQQWSEPSWHKMAEYAMWDTDTPGCVRLSALQHKRNTSIVSAHMYETFKK